MARQAREENVAQVWEQGDQGVDLGSLNYVVPPVSVLPESQDTML